MKKLIVPTLEDCFEDNKIYMYVCLLLLWHRSIYSYPPLVKNYFLRKKGGTRELLPKEKKELFFRAGHHFWRNGNSKGFDTADFLFFHERMERAHVTDYLPGALTKNSTLVN